MGQAKKRGTFDERKAQAITKTHDRAVETQAYIDHKADRPRRERTRGIPLMLLAMMAAAR